MKVAVRCRTGRRRSSLPWRRCYIGGRRRHGHREALPRARLSVGGSGLLHFVGLRGVGVPKPAPPPTPTPAPEPAPSRRPRNPATAPAASRACNSTAINSPRAWAPTASGRARSRPPFCRAANFSGSGSSLCRLFRRWDRACQKRCSGRARSTRLRRRRRRSCRLAGSRPRLPRRRRRPNPNG